MTPDTSNEDATIKSTRRARHHHCTLQAPALTHHLPISFRTATSLCSITVAALAPYPHGSQQRDKAGSALYRSSCHVVGFWLMDGLVEVTGKGGGRNLVREANSNEPAATLLFRYVPPSVCHCCSVGRPANVVKGRVGGGAVLLFEWRLDIWWW